ncbi:LLM class flavin-dependent oxidoreductase [Mesorhizobium sp. M1E.F.Ca.ET.041.01.1.1]|uniref:LLM class flavin-dependent oxidoreductase n=1 Tax=Mesorhizobium sp. M1E.F.Ca.ET.041.01.1.1 TaxID=2496759 RepID=UPI0016756F7C|nr:LLM class flavin-dependent oxidoreductase [Mesorhizobium sp. M1E.F.Ca.ET.041.01.1.1]
MELGIYSFGDLVADPNTGKKPTSVERMRRLMDMARLADDAGLDVIGIGEHHGLDFVNSATATLISGLAAATKRIRFTSASTLLSTADPVRTFQEFSMADLVSGGRVEIIFGRGAFNDNFPLFGFDMKDYDALFAEKLQLFELLNANERVTWSGKFRAPLQVAEIAPRPHQPKLPVSIGALSQGSVGRAAKLGYPLVIPVLGGSMEGYAKIAAYYRAVWAQSGRRQEDAKIALFSHFHVTETARETEHDFYRYYSAYMRRMFRGPIPAATYAHMLSPRGTFVGGSVQQVVDKISMLKEATGAYRYVGQIDVGAPRFETIAKGIELMASKVADQLR